MKIRKRGFIKNLKDGVEDIIQFLKNKMFSSKYVVKGKCKQCGECCRTILFSDERGYIKSEEDFLKLQRENRRYLHFDISGKVNEPDNKFLDGALTFKCKSLGDDGKCTKYFLRSLYCRDYPSINSDFIYNGGVTLDNCGFYFDVNKKFKDYLK